MATEFVTPVGRLVQGSLSLEIQKDDDGKVKLGDDGQPIKQCFLAVAFRKDDAQFNQFYALMVATARADFPHLFDAAGNCTHPQFSWKLQDGDGVDKNGKSVKDKPGFAGHWIVKFATQYMPKCYHEGKFDATQQIQNPNEVIKRGYFVRVAGQMRGNGVTPSESKRKPGIFISPNLVSLVAFGEEIVGGPDANKVFGAAPVTALPPGATAAPTVGAAAGAPALTAPPAPGAGPSLPGAAAGGAVPTLAPPGAPAAPAAPTLAPPAPAAPAAPAAPVYQMTASAMGNTREALIAQGWTDQGLLDAGHMVKVG